MFWFGRWRSDTVEVQRSLIIHTKSTAKDLNDVANHHSDLDKHFIIVNDISLADYTWVSSNIIGIDSDGPFAGVFDGKGHKISNFNYESNDTDCIDLFACVDDLNAEIKELILIGPNVDAGKGYFAGSLVGLLSRETVFGCLLKTTSVPTSSRVHLIIYMKIILV